MKLDIEDYRGKLRDTKLENELAKSLRTSDEGEAFAFLMELVDVHLVAALDIASRVLKERKHFSLVLERGLRDSNASTIKHWINCVEPHLGTKRLIGQLQSKLDEYPDGVSRAVYFVKQKVKADDNRAKESLAVLVSELEKRGIMRGPNIIVEDGKRLLAPIEPLSSSDDDN